MMKRSVGAVTAPEVESMTKFVVVALLANVFVPAPVKVVVEVNADELARLPESICADVPLKTD